jgi:hypothetical protein
LWSSLFLQICIVPTDVLMECAMHFACVYGNVLMKHDQTSYMHKRSVPCHNKGGNFVVSPPLYWVGWCISSARDLYLWDAWFKSQPGHYYPDCNVSWFSSLLGKCWDSTLIRFWLLSCRFFPIHHSSIAISTVLSQLQLFWSLFYIGVKYIHVF